MFTVLVLIGLWPTLGAMAPQSAASEVLITLFGDLWHWKTQENPEFATQVGLNDNTAGRLDSYNAERHSQRLTFARELLDRANEIEPEMLEQNEKISLLVFQDILKNYITNSKYIRFFHPILSLEGPHLRLQHLVTNMMVLQSYNDFQKLLSRYGEFPRQADEILLIMKRNMELGIMPHSMALHGVLEQFDALDVPVVDSPFFKPFLQIPLSFPPEQRQTLRQQAQERISQDLLPSFKKIRQLLNESYIQNTRPKPSISTVNNGSEYYAAALEYFTSTRLPATEVHSIGLSEVNRIERKIIEVASKCEEVSSSNVDEIFDAMRQSTSDDFSSRESLAESLHTTAFQKIKPKISSLFENLPSDNLTIEHSSEEFSTHPYPIWYEPPSVDGNRPGLLHIDQNDVTSLNQHDITPVALNLCYPGRHFHSVFLQVSTEVPLFRKITQGTRWSLGPAQLSQSPAFAEGWAAYSEFLGEELNLYGDTCTRLSRGARELTAAVRLVVDTGIHALDWSIDAASDYFKMHTNLPYSTIDMELKHIISFPGKACSPKIGEIKLRELRQRAKNALGTMFIPQEFHKTLLRCTSSLHIAQKCIANYILDNIHAPESENHNERDVKDMEPTEAVLLINEGESSSFRIYLQIPITYTLVITKLLWNYLS